MSLRVTACLVQDGWYHPSSASQQGNIVWGNTKREF